MPQVKSRIKKLVTILLITVGSALVVALIVALISFATVFYAVDRLASPDPDTRAAAATILADSENPYARYRLYKLFQTAPIDSHLREGVFDAFWRAGPSSISALVRSTHAPPPDPANPGTTATLPREVMLQDARKIVERMGPPAADPLIALLADPDPLIRADAAELLGLTASPDALPALLPLLQDNDFTVRLAALRALSHLQDPAAVGPLTTVLTDDPRSQCRQSAARALTWLRHPDSVMPLIAALDDEDNNVRSAAAFSLGMTRDPRAVAPLLALLSSPDDSVRSSAASALGYIADPRTLNTLLSLLDDPASRVRASAADALGSLRDPSALEPLLSLLDDPAGYVRGSAASALGHLRDPSALEPLIRLLPDPEPFVRQRVIMSLSEFNDPRIVDPLISLMPSDKFATRRSVLKGLLRFPDVAVPKLKPLLSHDSDVLRWRAAVILEIIATPDSRSLVDDFTGENIQVLADNYRELISSGGGEKEIGLLAIALERHGTFEMAADLYWSGCLPLQILAADCARRKGFFRNLNESTDSPSRPKWPRKGESP